MKKNGNDPKVKSKKRGKNIPKAPKRKKAKSGSKTYSDNNLPKMSSTSSNRKKSTSTATRYSPQGDWRYDSFGAPHPAKPSAKRTEPRPSLDTFSKKKKR